LHVRCGVCLFALHRRRAVPSFHSLVEAMTDSNNSGGMDEEKASKIVYRWWEVRNQEAPEIGKAGTAEYWEAKGFLAGIEYARKQMEKARRCNCERCTGIAVDSFYAEAKPLSDAPSQEQVAALVKAAEAITARAERAYDIGPNSQEVHDLEEALAPFRGGKGQTDGTAALIEAVNNVSKHYRMVYGDKNDMSPGFWLIRKLEETAAPFQKRGGQ
jgi:hypothetical protein